MPDMDSTRSHITALLVALVLGLTALATPATGRAEGTRAQVLVSARIAAYFRVSEIQQPQALAVEERHVRQGYVDLPNAGSFQVASNTRAPILLNVGYDATLVERVELVVGDRRVVAAQPGDGGLVPNPLLGKHRINVNYRIYLRPTAAPGVYQWPLAMAMAPSA